MIPPAFAYVRATTVADALAVLAEHGDEAKVLAGGHSLLPLMKLRLAYPAVLVDIAGLDGTRGVRDGGDHLVIGATTTHDEVMRDALVQRHCAVLAETIAVVADPQVRHRGTIGGALAHGDAAGDLPAAALALDATFVIQGAEGRREVPASAFFHDYLETALTPTDLLLEIRVPKLSSAWTGRYEKFARASHMWAIVGACVLVRRNGDGIGAARVGLTNMASVPLRATATEEALASATLDAIPAAAGMAADGTDPPADLNAQPEYRRHLARVLTERALQRLVSAWN